MTRRHLAFPALAATTVLLTACGSSDSTEQEAPADANAGSTTSQSTSSAESSAAESSGTADIYSLPGTGVFPEGITADDETFYVTATGDGAVFRGTLGQLDLETFLEGGSDGRTGAAGIDVTDDDDVDRLIIAGGTTGTVWIYNSESGELVGTFTNGLGEDDTFLNDVAIADNGDVYITDSRNPALYRIPADLVRDGAQDGPLESFVDFAGTEFEYGEGFNANGIVEVDDALVIGQSSTGNLYRVDVNSKEVTQVDLGGETLENADGLELDDDTLYVVRNSDGLIATVDLADDGTSGRVTGEITDPSFAYPTTVAATDDRLLVVNSQFDERGGEPVEPFTVSSIPQ